MIVATSPSIDTATQWAAIDPNPITSKYTSDLIDKALSANDESARSLESMFPSNGERISFGTAGLRSEMKPGPLGMNDLTVCQTAQGLAKYCLKQGQQKGGSEDGVKPSRLCAVVGYDHRSNPSMNISSLSFAILTAIVFAEAGIDCILLDGFVLTPLVPFALQQLGAVCGIMITASHNPKQDNGYKVYASDGCQIRAPMDKEIASEILDNLQPWTDYETIIEERTRNYPNDPCLGLSRPQTTKEMLDEYFITLENSGLKSGQGGIQSSRCSSEHCDGSLEPPSFAYTAMHGIGYPFAKRAFEVFGLRPFHAVPEQREPDPSFPTVPFPNPEEAGALDLGKVFATENGCDIVLANDPDADRLAVAEKDRTTGEWTVFSGDQIGVMLGLWIWETTGVKSDKPVSMCVSTVSSKMLAEIGRREGFHVEETLTGFKWIGSRSVSLETEGYRNLFGYEEAIGFACGSVGFDKDGISAMVVMSELALYVYRERGISLKHHMESLYDKYGYFVSSNGYYFMHDQSTVKIIMNRLRSDGSYDTLKQVVAPYEIESIRDLGNPGYDSLQADNKPTLPTSGKAPMMTIRFANGCIIQLRPSGTEPKFKYYTEMKGRPGIPKDTVEKELKTMVDTLLDRLLQPLQNGLIKKA
eukprot:CAMPEP_0172359380 /NCGR_PEP_ID=MMETSP1060-20121228/3585_1 /TAXON_ID=37318 /ORGANISM="Pseudo-nitzschia pungens, Strain cf. cingulata" /LENGTH=641 /DNA_ID=CAMNT_0013081003 /DNA_START=50 /DNA_END=1975 /DNA_ORIENTATION=-